MPGIPRLRAQRAHRGGVRVARGAEPDLAPPQSLRGAHALHRPRARGEHLHERVVPELNLRRALGVAKRHAGARHAGHQQSGDRGFFLTAFFFCRFFLRRFLVRRFSSLPDERVDELREGTCLGVVPRGHAREGAHQVLQAPAAQQHVAEIERFVVIARDVTIARDIAALTIRALGSKKARGDGVARARVRRDVHRELRGRASRKLRGYLHVRPLGVRVGR